MKTPMLKRAKSSELACGIAMTLSVQGSKRVLQLRLGSGIAEDSPREVVTGMSTPETRTLGDFREGRCWLIEVVWP